MRGETTIRFDKVGGGKTRVTITAYDNQHRPVATLAPEFTQPQIRALVLDLCQKAGLPRPW